MRPCVDLITMTDEQCDVLDRMDSFLGVPMRTVAADTSVPLKRCRTIIHRFHELGFADFGPLYDEDSAELRGRGYWLSIEGAQAQRLMRRLFDYRRAFLLHFEAPPASLTRPTEGDGH